MRRYGTVHITGKCSLPFGVFDLAPLIFKRNVVEKGRSEAREGGAT